MLSTLNKVILIGYTGDEIKLKYTAPGLCIGKVSVATDDVYVTAKGQTYTTVQWHRVILKNQMAESFEEMVPKGTLVYLEGKLRTREWVDQGGIQRNATDIYASEFKILNNNKLETN